MVERSEAEALWKAVNEVLKQRLNREVYEMWFSHVRAAQDHLEGRLVLGVLNEFHGIWLRDNYSGLLQKIVLECAKVPLQIDFVVLPTSKGVASKPDPLAQSNVRKASRPSSKSNKRGMEMFNPNYTFETLVVAKSNEMAHGAAMGVAQNPGKSHNPLFIYGSVGLGKTHLLHAIGHYVAEHRQHANIAYLSCEKFTNEFIERLGNNQLPRFRKRYRRTDVLLLDDVQFLSGKKQTQEEFFHTFNALHEAHRQIVITCDRPACEISKLEERLVSRFEWGLVADLQPPDAETRLAILRRKAKSLRIELPSGILEFLAERIRANVRRLEGALIRVATYKEVPRVLGEASRDLTIEQVEDLLRDILQEEGKNSVTIEGIQKKVATHYDIRLADMSSRRRPESIAFPRQVAMFLSRDLTSNSFSAIGEAFGGRDHGTVMYACRVVENRMDTDQKIRQDVSYLKRQLQR